MKAGDEVLAGGGAPAVRGPPPFLAPHAGRTAHQTAPTVLADAGVARTTVWAAVHTSPPDHTDCSVRASPASSGTPGSGWGMQNRSESRTPGSR